MELHEDVLKRIEENRVKALKRLGEKKLAKTDREGGSSASVSHALAKRNAIETDKDAERKEYKNVRIEMASPACLGPFNGHLDTSHTKSTPSLATFKGVDHGHADATKANLSWSRHEYQTSKYFNQTGSTGPENTPSTTLAQRPDSISTGGDQDGISGDKGDVFEDRWTSSSIDISKQNGLSSPQSQRLLEPGGSSCRPFLGTIHMELFSTDQFSVTDVPSLASLFKSVAGYRYDAREKKWVFPLREYNNLLPLIKEREPKAKQSIIPTSILNYFSVKSKSKASGGESTASSCNFASLNELDFDLSLIDERLKNSLLPFQLAGLVFALKKEGRILLADDMGLGKTIQALAIASFYKREWPLLIIVPASLVASWEQAVSEWLPSVSPQSIRVIYSGKGASLDGYINILSYDMVVKMAQEASERKFQVVILDESHYLKNMNTKRTKTLIPIAKKANRVLLLSGTPALSRPIELFPQIQTLNSKLFPNMIEYGIRYCAAYKGNFGWDYKGSSHLKELSIILEHSFMIRRLKQHVLSQLPAKRRQQVFLHIEPSRLKPLRDLMSEMESSRDLDGLQNSSAAMKLWRESGIVKLPAVQEYIFDILERDDATKVLIFAHHHHILEGLESSMWSKKIPFIRIDGSTAATDRLRFCTDFQENSRIRAALLSVTAAGIGLTLTAASVVIFAELYWNPGMLIQAEDRAHRIGQKDSVNVHYLLAQGTFDDKIWPLIINKLAVLESVGLSKNEFSGMTTAGVAHKENQKTLLEFVEFSNAN